MAENDHPIFDMLEPRAKTIIMRTMPESVELSKAISLKRIADALDDIRKTQALALRGSAAR